jgi:dTDP-4-dehydrorhamnose reductase
MTVSELRNESRTGSELLQIKVLVTGGSGRLGRALSQAGGPNVRGFSRAELDITDAGAVQTVFERLRPDVVINAAAESSVGTSDTAPERARAVNAIAPGDIARVCSALGVPLIHISTDYVFGAETLRPWREMDPVSPVNSYGRLKAEGERNVLAAGGRACVVRVAWLFGDGEDFIASLLRGQDATVKVSDDQIGSPTPILVLARRLLELARRMSAGEAIPRLLHLAGSPPVSRADWVAAAFEALRRAGRRTPELVRVPMAEFGSAVLRPHYSALDCNLAAELFGEAIDWRLAIAQPALFADQIGST